MESGVHVPQVGNLWHRVTRIFCGGFVVLSRCASTSFISLADLFGGTGKWPCNFFGRSSYRHFLLCDSRPGTGGQIVSRKRADIHVHQENEHGRSLSWHRLDQLRHTVNNNSFRKQRKSTVEGCFVYIVKYRTILLIKS